jgi:hypothetical protein
VSGQDLATHLCEREMAQKSDVHAAHLGPKFWGHITHIPGTSVESQFRMHKTQYENQTPTFQGATYQLKVIANNQCSNIRI